MDSCDAPNPGGGADGGTGGRRGGGGSVKRPVALGAKKVLAACLQCKKRRRKCTGVAPCELCSRMGLECIFEKDAGKIPHHERKLVMMFFRMLQIDLPMVDQAVFLSVLSGSAFEGVVPPAGAGGSGVGTTVEGGGDESPMPGGGSSVGGGAAMPAMLGSKRARVGGGEGGTDGGGSAPTSAGGGNGMRGGQGGGDDEGDGRVHTRRSGGGGVDGGGSEVGTRGAGHAYRHRGGSGSRDGPYPGSMVGGEKPHEEAMLESLLDVNATAPFADEASPVACVDRYYNAFACHVLYHAMVAMGASLVGRTKEVHEHYHRAVALLGPVVGRPSNATVSSLFMLALVTRVASNDVRQCVHLLRLAASMVNWDKAEGMDPYSLSLAVTPPPSPTSTMKSVGGEGGGGGEVEGHAPAPTSKRPRLDASTGDGSGITTAVPVAPADAATVAAPGAFDAGTSSSSSLSTMLNTMPPQVAPPLSHPAAASQRRAEARARLRDSLRINVQPEVALGLSLFLAMTDPEADYGGDMVDGMDAHPHCGMGSHSGFPGHGTSAMTMTHSLLCSITARFMRHWVGDFHDVTAQQEPRERRLLVEVSKYCQMHLSPISRLVRTYLLDAFSGMLHWRAGRVQQALDDFHRGIHVQAMLSPERRMKSVLYRVRNLCRRVLRALDGGGSGMVGGQPIPTLTEAQRASLISIESQASTLLVRTDRLLDDFDVAGALPPLNPIASPAVAAAKAGGAPGAGGGRGGRLPVAASGVAGLDGDALRAGMGSGLDGSGTWVGGGILSAGDGDDDEGGDGGSGTWNASAPSALLPMVPGSEHDDDGEDGDDDDAVGSLGHANTESFSDWSKVSPHVAAHPLNAYLSPDNWLSMDIYLDQLAGGQGGSGTVGAGGGDGSS